MSTLIQLRNIHKSYGDTVLFDDESVDLARGDRIGVIGRNGAGKSTLCKAILGNEDLDGGSVIRNSKLRLSYLEQHRPFEPGEGVLEYLMRATEREEWDCARVAARFQIREDSLGATVDSLSGGFQTRVKLIAMLLGEPNFLVLDEPTNYLDLRTLLLLERFLADFSGGYLIVSHDREFLKRTCTKTLEVESGGLFLFPGDIEAYVKFKIEQREQADRYNRNVEVQRRHLQNFVDRYRVGKDTATRAQSKMKQLAKLETIETGHPMSTARVKIPPVEEKKGVAIRCTDLVIGYPDHTVAEHITFEIERGQHVAVLGDNGQGKTTLLRTIAGEIEAFGGTFRWGHNLTPGYYAQHVYSALEQGTDIVTYLTQQAAPGLVDQDILDMAGSFLFKGHDVQKSIDVLSGGERARVCLAGLLLSRQPVLLLDEPTNHLDFETVEALGKALQDYKGTIFFVSHDRTFVNLVATNIVDVRDRRVTLYPGDYESYVYQTEQEVDQESERADRLKTERAAIGKKSAPKKSDYHLRKEQRARLNKLKRQIESAEKTLSEYGKERAELHQYFLTNPTDHAPEKAARATELDRLLPETEEQWLTLQTELEDLRESDP